MPSFDFIKETTPSKSFRVASVMGRFDLQSEHILEQFKGSIDIEGKDWNIGVIVGASGSGKTSVAKQLFPDAYFNGFEYKASSVLDDFPENIEVADITNMFNKVGFSSPPSWLKPYAVLSNGEKMRVDLARALLQQQDLIVFDEFTSVVDRNVAKIGSAVVQKVVRRANKQFIAVTCHEDVLEWLEPDWVFNTNDFSFFFGKQFKRPSIELKIYKCDKSYWRLFRKHHYLNTELSPAAQCYIATIDNKPVAFQAVLHFPHPRERKFKSSHRLVVLPDYQGLGIGSKFQEVIAKLYCNNGFRFIETSSTLALIKSRQKNPHWVCTRIGRAIRNNETSKTVNMQNTSSQNRITLGWEYKL